MKQQTSNLEIDVDGSYEVAGSHGHANRFLRISTAFAANYFHELEMITLFGMRRYIRTAANHCENSFLLRKSLTNVRIENKNVYEKNVYEKKRSKCIEIPSKRRVVTISWHLHIKAINFHLIEYVRLNEERRKFHLQSFFNRLTAADE